MLKPSPPLKRITARQPRVTNFPVTSPLQTPFHCDSMAGIAPRTHRRLPPRPACTATGNYDLKDHVCWELQIVERSPRSFAGETVCRTQAKPPGETACATISSTSCKA